MAFTYMDLQGILEERGGEGRRGEGRGGEEGRREEGEEKVSERGHPAFGRQTNPRSGYI